MNKRGQMIFYGFMLSVTIIVLALALAGPVQVVTSNAMQNDTGFGEMNCTSTSDIYVKSACVTTDLTTPYFFGGLVTIAGLVMGAKIYFDA